MRTRILFFLLFVISGRPALARQQGAAVAPDAVIERVEVSGVSDAKLSPGLRDDIQKLTSQTYNAAGAASIVDRIQAELPEYVAEPQTSPGSQPNRVRLTFKIAKIADDEALGANINARYTVESVEVEGVPRSSVSDGLYAEMQQMVGQPLDNRKAASLNTKLWFELYKTLLPGALGFDIERKVARGTNPQQVRIVYSAHRVTNSVGFNPFGLLSFNYHSSMGFEWQTPLTLSYRHRWAGSFTALAEDTRLDLIERNSGIAFKYAPPPFTRLLQPSVSYASDRVRWRPQTINAAQDSATAPRLYRLRDTSGATVDWDVPIDSSSLRRRWLSLTTGADFNNLEVDAPGRRFEKANAAHISMNFSASRRTDGASDSVTAHYDLRAGVPALGSDYSYQRQELRLSYYHPIGKPNTANTDWQNFEVSFWAGNIAGSAPLFEQFALGDTQTLLGWNKFDITPLGGDRFVQITAKYARPNLDVTYYAGTVWNLGTEAIVRQSVAVGIPNRLLGCRQRPKLWDALLNPACMVHVKIAVPLRESHFKPALILGYRF